jgi:hypothetical protein
MKDTYTESLAAHLDANRHPLPSPTLSEHGQRLTRQPIRIAPDESIDAMRERLLERQREIDAIIGTDGDIGDIPAYNVRGLLLGAASLIVLGLMMWVAS